MEKLLFLLRYVFLQRKNIYFQFFFSYIIMWGDCEWKSNIFSPNFNNFTDVSMYLYCLQVEFKHLSHQIWFHGRFFFHNITKSRLFQIIWFNIIALFNNVSPYISLKMFSLVGPFTATATSTDTLGATGMIKIDINTKIFRSYQNKKHNSKNITIFICNVK